ncbi:MAG: methyltransferase domain-containing protein [Deltaproteobacteria bacterium]|nr:methyltransferase domain-containing protein [Deltaproteobacteria bacterium]
MAKPVCPWWLGWFLAHPWRRRIHNPAGILRPYISEGMTVLEPGPGMGFFTMELARLAGPTGRVVAVDVQPRMLEGVRRRAEGRLLLAEPRLEVSEAEFMKTVDAAGKHGLRADRRLSVPWCRAALLVKGP